MSKTMTPQSTVQGLAKAYGIQPEWRDIWGNVHPVDESVCKALLSAMHVPVENRSEVDAAFDRLQHQTVARWLDWVCVMPETEPEPTVCIHLSDRLRHKMFQWRLEQENGEQTAGQLTGAELRHVEDVSLSVHPERIGRFEFRLPHLPPKGYHRFVLIEPESGQEADMRLIVTPTRCYVPGVLLESQEPETQPAKVWGPAVQLYAVNSSRNWGMGDYGDLLRLVDWCADQGAAVLGMNPLHALFPHNPNHASPYSPSSRVFFNVLLLDVEAVEDFAESEEARQLVLSPAFQQALAQLREESLVNYPEVGQRKLEVLALLYQSFCRQHLPKNTLRAKAFNDYIRQGGLALERFALFHALQERFHSEDPGIWGWPVWPEAYRDPDSLAVREFAEANRERIGFYQYLQWQADNQLHKAGIRCLERGLGVGLYMDLAVGVDRGGADVWANQHLFAQSAAVGAPPDEYNPKGQDWGLPPWIPEKLREDRYGAFIEILRHNMRHAGALRIDHVMGLMRLFWIPPEMGPDQGAYVHYPVDELFGILALESQRHRCMVIGEDLGTVPEAIRERMTRWGVFSYKVFYFEKQAADQFRPPQEYQADAAVAVSTHDLPTLAGFWEGRDIAVRTELDLYPNTELRDRQIKDRVMERIGILKLLEAHDLLPEGVTTDPASAPQMTPALAASIYRLVAQSRAKVLMVQMEDLLQQVDQINLPGTVAPTYPNWKRKLTVPLEAFYTDERVLETCRLIEQERPRWVAPRETLASEMAQRAASLVPRATYRFQFNQNFTFRQAAELVPYLHRLGVSHCYASPLLTARSGSPHGYDITDHKQLNTDVGSREDFKYLTDTLHAHGMGLIVDIVPNHMGAGKDNPWWMDVLENGPSSLYADYFDIDWQPLADDLQNKILLAILGDAYGRILENGELKLRFEPESGRFWLDYWENQIPIDPQTYPTILGHRLEVLETRLGDNKTPFYEYQSIVSSLAHLPVETGGDLARKEERSRERTVALNRLIVLGQNAPEVLAFIEENVQDFQARQEDPTTLSRLNRLLEQQNYRLANWRVASDEINYRRFFDINDLVAVRVEDPRVFHDTHDLIMELVEQGRINGLRIDHPDGLYDPAGYFRRLQEEAARRLGLPESEDWGLGASNLPLYVLIEKILAPFERLPDEWTVQGTTGYEFANSVNGLFVRQENEKEMTRIYERLLGRRVDFEDLVYECKKLIMRTTLNSELGVLTYQLNRISKANWSSRDFTLHNLRSALIEVVASFPVYRTYVTPDHVSKKDREYIDWAIRSAKRRSTAIDTTIFDFIRQVLLLEHVETAGDNEVLRQAIVHFAMKFQQYTGPVMAKGLEDTSFYRYNRLVSLNEVGGEPGQFGISVNTFHYHNAERQRRTPHTLLNTSTHDTKRSEDVRARISVLSEMPDEWQKHVTLWRRINRTMRKDLEDGQQAPSPNDTYLFYQTLVGLWPVAPPSEEELKMLADRVEQYMLKAVKEAKSHTSWINPNLDYEETLSQYVRGVLLRPSKIFMNDFVPFQRRVARFGLFNSLSQTLLKLTCPGVPDLYQGTELWDFSLVDPDNRRPINYEQRQAVLNELKPVLEAADPEAKADYLKQLTDSMSDGRVKQYLVATVLKTREAHPELFREGEYIPLEISGAYTDHVVAFARQYEDTVAITVVPRWLYTLGLKKSELPCGRKVWKDTAVVLPAQWQGVTRFYNAVNGESIQATASGELRVADVLSNFPVGFLTGKVL